MARRDPDLFFLLTVRFYAAPQDVLLATMSKVRASLNVSLRACSADFISARQVATSHYLPGCDSLLSLTLHLYPLPLSSRLL